jgi:hypothetical protein
VAIACFALAPRAEAAIETDFVFVINATATMDAELTNFQTGLSTFLDDLDTPQISARYAIVLFGGSPELVLDFTTDKQAVLDAFDQISTVGAVTDFQRSHIVGPDALQEAIRVVLNEATFLDSDFRTNVGGTGPLEFREEARINIVAVTDGDSDLPFYEANRQPGQTGTDPPSPLDAAWQAEVDATAAALIEHAAFLNLIMNGPQGASIQQLGDPLKDVSSPDGDLQDFDPAATLQALIDAGLGDSLQAQLLAAGLLARTFRVSDLAGPEPAANAAFVERFFGAKVQEVLNDGNLAVIPEPASLCVWTVLGALGAGAGWWRRRKRRAAQKGRGRSQPGDEGTAAVSGQG